MAFDYDVVIVGSGPAGLTAGLHLGRAGKRVIVLEKDLFGGALQHTGLIEDYPPCPGGILGADLAGQMIEQTTSSGVPVEQAEVSGIELFSRSRWVACSDGRGFSCGVVILAGGTHYTRLGLANEDRFRGRGVVDCTPCDGGFFVDRDVVVYGSGDFAVRDAVYLAELGSRVTVLSPEPELKARPELQQRLQGVAVRHAVRLEAITGDDRVSGVEFSEAGSREQLPAHGVLIRVATEPATAELADTFDVDGDGYLVTGDDLETSERFVLACGDIRTGATRTVAGAVADGEAAAARALALLATLDA